MAILIVDDEEPLRRVLRRVLEPEHTVDDAATVEEARQQLAAKSYELVLCDLKLAGESGLELVKSLAPDAPETVVVMVTGVDEPETAEQALAFGVYGYLVKPFTRNEVRITVAGALRRRALELARTKLEEHESELRLLADRERIGRDLHDAVIQRLFCAGLVLQRASPLIMDGDARRRIDETVDDLDETIRVIRSVIFEVESPRSSSVRGSVLDLARQSARTLGFEPTVAFSGAVDTLVDGAAAEQLLATLREALTNVARHAAARRVDVRVAVDRDVVLDVRDDGVGIGAAVGTGRCGRGLANMSARAEQLGGQFAVEAGPTGGTHVEWRIPLDGH